MTSAPRHHNHLPDEAPTDLRWFYQYWASKRRGDGGNPARIDIDPGDFPKLLNTTFIVERMPDGRHKMRLAGTYYRHLYGKEITGAFIEDLTALNGAGKALTHAQAECARSNGPVYTEASVVPARATNPVMFKRLLLPLAAERDQVAYMIGTAVFFDGESRRIDTANWRAN